MPRQNAWRQAERRRSGHKRPVAISEPPANEHRPVPNALGIKPIGVSADRRPGRYAREPARNDAGRCGRQSVSRVRPSRRGARATGGLSTDSPRATKARQASLSGWQFAREELAFTSVQLGGTHVPACPGESEGRWRRRTRAQAATAEPVDRDGLSEDRGPDVNHSWTGGRLRVFLERPRIGDPGRCLSCIEEVRLAAGISSVPGSQCDEASREPLPTGPTCRRNRFADLGMNREV
jgi:hypothetical protein